MVSSHGGKEGLEFVIENEPVELMVETDVLSFRIVLLGKEGQWFRSNNEGHEEHLHHFQAQWTQTVEEAAATTWGGLQTFYSR